MASKITLRSAAWRLGYTAPEGAANPFEHQLADKFTRARARDWQEGHAVHLGELAAYGSRQAAKDAKAQAAREARNARARAARRAGLVKARATRRARQVAKLADVLAAAGRDFDEAGQRHNATLCHDAAKVLAGIRIRG